MHFRYLIVYLLLHASLIGQQNKTSFEIIWEADSSATKEGIAAVADDPIILIRSNIAALTLKIDGVMMPLEATGGNLKILRLKPGAHQLVFGASGYYSQVRNVLVAPGTIGRVNVLPRTTIRITADRALSYLNINGNAIKEDMKVEVEPGDIIVRAQPKNRLEFSTLDTTITVPANKYTSYSLKINKRHKPKHKYVQPLKPLHFSAGIGFGAQHGFTGYSWGIGLSRYMVLFGYDIVVTEEFTSVSITYLAGSRLPPVPRAVRYGFHRGLTRGGYTSLSVEKVYGAGLGGPFVTSLPFEFHMGLALHIADKDAYYHIPIYIMVELGLRVYF